MKNDRIVEMRLTSTTILRFEGNKNPYEIIAVYEGNGRYCDERAYCPDRRIAEEIAANFSNTIYIPLSETKEKGKSLNAE